MDILAMSAGCRRSLAGLRRAGAAFLFVSPLLTAPAAAETIFNDFFSGAYPGAWTIGHDGGGGTYAWAWPTGYAHCYANPSVGPLYYPNNLHVYMERRNVSLVGYNQPTLSFSYI